LARLSAQCGQEDCTHIGIGFDREHVVAGAGQPNGLRSLASAHIEDSSRMLRHVPVQLARDHLLPDHVANVVQPAKPRRPPGTEGAVASGVATSRVSAPYHRANATSPTERQAAIPVPPVVEYQVVRREAYFDLVPAER